MYEEMFNARKIEIAAADRTLRQRMEWHEGSRIERLENALRVARVRVNWPGSPVQAKAN
jgi:hypothetical protein